MALLILDSHLVMRVGKFHSRFGLYNIEAARAAAETLAELTSVAKALNTFKLHSNASGGSFRRSMIIRPPARQPASAASPTSSSSEHNCVCSAGGDEHKQVTACRRRVSAYCERAICFPNHLSLLMHFNLRTSETAFFASRTRAYRCFVCADCSLATGPAISQNCMPLINCDYLSCEHFNNFTRKIIRASLNNYLFAITTINFDFASISH